MQAAKTISLSLVTAIAIVVAAPAQQYSVREIGTVNGARASQPGGINNHLHIAGSAEVGGGEQPYLWSLHGVVDPGPPVGGYAWAVNDSEQVVGCGYFAVGDYPHAFLWTDAGGPQDLGTLGEKSSCAFGINSGGQAVGSVSDETTAHAFSWTQAGGMQDLGTLGGVDSFAYGVNDNGQVVGLIQPTADPNGELPFIWSEARGMRELPLLPGALYMNAVGINNLGQIVGVAIFVNGNQHVVLWPHLLSGGVLDLGALPGSTVGVANAINVNGIVVGYSILATATHGFVWTAEGGVQDLNDLIPADSDWVVQRAVAINGVGAIVAWGVKKGASETAFAHTLLLTPKP